MLVSALFLSFPLPFSLSYFPLLFRSSPLSFPFLPLPPHFTSISTSPPTPTSTSTSTNHPPITNNRQSIPHLPPQKGLPQRSRPAAQRREETRRCRLPCPRLPHHPRRRRRRHKRPSHEDAGRDGGERAAEEVALCFFV